MYAPFAMRFAIRQLLKSPGFTVIALLTLALAIGINTTVFTVLNRLLFQTLPFVDSGRLVQIWANSPAWTTIPQAPGDYFVEKEQNTVFDRMTAYHTGGASVAEAGQLPVQLNSMVVDADFIPLMGIAPRLGRAFVAQDLEHRTAFMAPVVLLGNTYWRKHYGGDPNTLGRTLRVNGTPVTIIGVQAPAFDDPVLFGSRIDIWILDATATYRSVHEGGWYWVAAHLKPKVAIGTAQAEMTAIAARLAHDFPATNAHRGFKVVPFPTDTTNDVSRSIYWLFMALTLVVLFIACANLANLQLVRTTGRAREFAVRAALGAPGGEIRHMLLMECLVLSTAAGALGLLFTAWARSYWAAFFDLDMPIDFRVTGFALGASTLTGAAFALVPAWIASRSDLISTLKLAGRGTSTDRSRHRVRQALIVSELSLSLVLLTGAGYFIRGIQQLSHRQLGWRPENLVVGYFSLPVERYGGEGDDRSRVFADKFRRDLLPLPGVDHVAISTDSPELNHGAAAFIIEGRPPPASGQEPTASGSSVSPDYFSTFGMGILQGREFTDADRRKGRAVAIINESMAEKFWPGESPLGKRIGNANHSEPDWAEIVGVTNNIAAGSDFYPPETSNAIYRPFSQSSNFYMVVALRSLRDPRVLKDEVRHTFARLEPDLVIPDLATAEESISSALSPLTVVRRMLVLIAAFGLLLSCVGIYGVIANLTSERTHEIGIRMAVGAQAGDVCWLFLGNGIRLALLGVAVGLAGSFWLVRILDRTVAIVPGNDPRFVIGVAALLVFVAVLACWLPAQRATKVNPLVALRAE